MRHRHGNRTICNLIALCVMVVSLTIFGCGSDSDFSGADIREIENRTFTFSDGRVFGLEGQTVTLTIEDFGDDDTALFTLATNPTARGTLDIDESTLLNPNEANCDFSVGADSDFTEEGLRPGDEIPTECLISNDGSQLQLTNRNTGQVSTGILQP